MNRRLRTKGRSLCWPIILPALIWALPASAQYTITTIAGGNPTDVAATSVSIGASAVTWVASPSPTLYIVAQLDCQVYKVDANSVLTVFAGNETDGYSGDRGAAVDAQLDFPTGVTADNAGNVYIIDGGSEAKNHYAGTYIRRIDPNGIITTFYTPPSEYVQIVGIVLDGLGSLYVAVQAQNAADNAVLQLDAATGNLIATFPQPASNPGLLPRGDNSLAVDSAGDIYAVNGDFVQKLVGNAFVNLAGNGSTDYVEGAAALATGFLGPEALAVVNSGDSAIVYVVDAFPDYFGGYIRKIAGGTVTTIAGTTSETAAGDNGPASQASFTDPLGLAVNSTGSVYVADDVGDSVREIWSTGPIAGDITTIAGGGAGDNISATGTIFTAGPNGIAVNQSTGTLYIADGVSRIRQVTGGIISTAAGTPTVGYSNGQATTSQLYKPEGVAVDASGNLFIADTINCVIREVKQGVMTTIAGNRNGGYHCTYTGDGPALDTGLNHPADIAVDHLDNVYVLEDGDNATTNAIRVIQGQTIKTLPMPAGYQDDSFYGLAVDSSGNVYVGDNTTGQVLSISAGAVTVVAHGFPNIFGLALDSSDNLYISDGCLSQVFKLAKGKLTLVAGNGNAGFSGDGGPASQAELDVPVSLAVDGSGNVYISDIDNSRVRVAIASTQSSPGDVVSIVPDSAAVGSPAFTLTVNGTGFTKGDVVLWNGSPIPTTFVTPSQLTATVSSALLSAADPSTVSVGSSNVVNFYVLAPTITSLNPSSTPGGNPQFTLTLTGTGFISGVSTVYFNGQALATTFVNSTTLTAIVPANENGFNVPVSVFNLSQSSNELVFTLGPQQYFCVAAGGVPPLLRVGGEAELLGDFVILCQPGASSDGVVNQDITITPSDFNFTSRILDTATNATEALLLIGEPAPADQVLGANVFQGQLIGSSIVFPAVPLDTTQSATLRFVNLRANTLHFALGQSQPQAAAVTLNMGPISVTNAVQILGFVAPTNFQAANVFSAGNLRSVDVSFYEAFANAFRTRVAAGGVQDQPGVAYNTESGFVNPAVVPGAGLADYGSRLILQLDGVPSGVNVYAAVSSDDGVSAVLVPADSTGAGGEGSTVAGSSMFGGTYAPVTISNGSGTAVWEVVSSDAALAATLSFHLVLTGMTAAGLGPITIQGAPAPLSPADTATATDPLPRFTSNLLTGFINMTLNSGSATATRDAGTQVAAALAANPLVASRTNPPSAPAPQSMPVADGATSSTAPPIQSGSSVTISYNLLNNSPAATTQVTVSSTVSSQLSVSGCTAPGGTCSTVVNSDGSTSVSAVYAGSVQPGEAPSFSYTASACNPSANPACTLNTTGTVSTTVMALNANQQFVNDSYPDDNVSGNTFQVISSSSPAPQVSIQLASNPAGLLLQIGTGAEAANPSTTISQSGTVSFQAITPQAGPSGSEYVFSSWSDGSTSASRTAVPAPIGGGTFTANYVTGYALNVTASKGGSVTLTPPGGYYAPNAVVEITANPTSGYEFSGFTGDVAGSGKTLQLVMPAQALNIQANFTDTPQKITFGPIANQTLGEAPFALTATASSGLTVTFTSNSTAVCTVSVATVTLLEAGTCSITASQPGNPEYEPATSVTQTFRVEIAQTITFGTLSNRALGTGTVTLSATASSSLVVSYKSNNTKVCTVSGAKVTLLEIGTCSITASQGGNTTYLAATPVTQTFSVLGEAQTIAFGALPNRTLGTASFVLSATATSHLTVSFASETMNTCTVSVTKVTLLTLGTCTILASQNGNPTTWAPATSVPQSFTILEAQTITFTAPPTQSLSAGTVALSATASSNLPVSYTSTSLNICTVSGATVTLITAGNCAITASQPGDGITWAAAEPVKDTFQIKSQ